jgi:hypothetical protein
MDAGESASWTEGTTLSRRSPAVLDEWWPGADSGSRTSVAGAAESRSTSSSRSTKQKRGLFWRTGIVLPAAGIAALLVAVVVVASYLLVPKGVGASSLFASIDELGQSGSVSALEQERQTIIAMDSAAGTLTVDAKPAQANPAMILAAQSAGMTSGGTSVAAPPAPANPTGAEAIAKALLPAYGFNQTTQWTCLYNLWMRESGWNVYAENTASGAYGIPQSLPADKMASVAADWQTNPTTQIKWGLGYIVGRYVTPCGAWQNEVDDGFY